MVDNKLNKVLEKNFDTIIRNRMKGESSLSSLNYSPIFQQDEISRLILVGNNKVSLGRYDYSPNRRILQPSDKFQNIQHQYLNYNDNYRKMWNLPNEAERKPQSEKLNKFENMNTQKQKEASSYSKDSIQANPSFSGSKSPLISNAEKIVQNLNVRSNVLSPKMNQSPSSPRMNYHYMKYY